MTLAAAGPRVPFVSIQIGPESLIDEGFEHVLGDVKERCAANVILVSTHSFAYGTIGRAGEDVSPGHGRTERPGEKWLGGSYVPVDAQYYRFTRLVPQRPAESETREVDVLAESLEPARRLGLRVYARIAENAINNAAIPLRAGETFDEMPGYADWIKPAIYHNSGGLRTHAHVRGVQRTVWGDLSAEATYAFYVAALGYQDLPAWEELPGGLPAGYVESETRRVVAAVRDEIPVYPGIDVDVPVGRGMREAYHRSEPGDVYAAVRAAFVGGAKGIVVSRKYSEARLENLDAVGAAVRSLTQS